MYPMIKTLVKSMPKQAGKKAKPNKRPTEMDNPTAPEFSKIELSYRVKADVDLTVKALYPLPESALWEALYDWIDSTPGPLSTRPLLTLLLMRTVTQAERVSVSTWRASHSLVIGFNDFANPVPQVCQLTWNPVIGAGRTRVSVTGKFLLKPSNRPGIPAYDIWNQTQLSDHAKKFALEAQLRVSDASEITLGEPW